MNMEEYKKYVNDTCKKIENKLDVNSEEFDFFINLVRTFNQVCIERNNLEQALNEIEKNYCNYYGITKEQNDNDILRYVLKEISEIINKAKGND